MSLIGPLFISRQMFLLLVKLVTGLDLEKHNKPEISLIYITPSGSDITSKCYYYICLADWEILC